jgi:hypothetical protein
MPGALAGAAETHGKMPGAHHAKSAHSKPSRAKPGGEKGKEKRKKAVEPDAKKAAAHYLAVVGPFNTALATFQADVKAKGTTLTATELGSAVAPVARALQRADQELSSYTWPKKARAAVATLVQADGALLGDLDSAGSVNALTASSWVQQLSRDDAVAGTDAGLVRAALGLPQASTGT